ncbi:MAG: VCBS repeat-containing protein [Candidatus Marinimicrobia bacterium]|nr:VCBS repeat-containing protein [Candidatus Neomarinimicrobiota bacterium]
MPQRRREVSAGHLGLGKPAALMLLLTVLTSCNYLRQDQPLFEKIAPRASGIFFENRLTEEPLFNSINYLYFYDGGGVAVGDINNDGLADIYFTANMQSNRLYLNKGDFRFEDITTLAGVAGGTAGWSTGVTMADVNGDGLLDIYVSRSNFLDKRGANQLFINNGDLTFTESAKEYGLDFFGLSRQAAFFDFDLDGDLDMYQLNHSMHAKETYGDTSLRRIRDPQAGDKFFVNEQGHFSDRSAEVGIWESILGYGLGVAIGDINRDGYPDIYISNDFHEDDYLYYNNGDGTFAEAMAQSMGLISSASMGNDMADINNDGLLDIAVLDMMPEDPVIRKSSVGADPQDIRNVKLRFGYHPQIRRNSLQLNRGAAPGGPGASGLKYHLFSEIGQFAGVHATDWSWAPLFADLDNDGFKDLFITNGIYRRPNSLDFLKYINDNDLKLRIKFRYNQQSVPPIDMEILQRVVEQMPSQAIANYAYQSQGDMTYVNRAAEWGLADPGFSSGAAYADFDNDGDLDLVVNNVNAPAALYRNRLYGADPDSLRLVNYLKVNLVGRAPNTFGIGAQVTLHYGDQLFFQHSSATRGFQSSVEPVLNFGLGKIQRLDSLEVIWPTGEYQVLQDIPASQTITLRQSDATRTYAFVSELPEPPFFRDVTDEVHLDFSHEENKFVEFNREPFIPHFLSTHGPALAVADINGDGLEDIYLGGAKHQPGAIYLQDHKGNFNSTADAVFAADALAEDVDALFFDANGDGLPDLYVVSGGNEFFGRSVALKDRLYLNMGGGRFRKSEASLPEAYANGATVAAADIDRDGDMDLFVGSRSVPRQYGMIPQSYLLINDGRGIFTDETSQIAAALSKVGMVTSAVWADLNLDGYQDLVVVGEWMPVTVFHNLNGILVDVTEKYELQDSRGWWNSVTAADINGDGLADLLVGNLGLNAYLKPAQRKPLQMHIYDFFGDGKLKQIFSMDEGQRSLPLASLEKMTAGIPSLGARYTSAADYATESIWDIFPHDQLQAATVRTVTEFATTLFINGGDGTFQRRKLPAETQFSPVYAIVVDDFNGDGHQDILLGGNFFGTEPEQGRYTASYGSLLLGDGSGAFAPVSLQRSGFAVTGEIRHIRKVRAASGGTLVIVARNNDRAVIFRKMVERP